MRKTVLGKSPALTKNECQNKHKGIAPLRVLCLCVFRKQHPVINIVVAGYLAAVVSVEFYDFRKVVIAFPFLEIFNQCLVGLAQLRLFAVAESAIKINSDCLEI